MPDHRPSVAGSARLIGACTLLSRVLGMARDILCSHFFGAGLFWDAFTIAYRVPNLFRRLFGEGALTSAFVPAFVSRLEAAGRAEAFALLNRLLTMLVAVLGAITLLGIGLTYPMAAIWPDEKMRLVAELLRIMLPYCLLVCAGAILGAALNGLFRFFAPAFAPVVLNVVWIVAVLAFAARWSNESAIRAVAVSIVVGGLLQFLTMAVPLAHAGARLRPRWELSDPGLRAVAANFLPGVFGLALVQINEVVDSVIAEIFVPGHGAVSALYYGNQLTQLPLSLIGTSLATAAFPGLAAAVARGDRSGFARLMRRSFGASFHLSLPAMVGLLLFARPIVELIFQHGRFTAEATARATAVLQLYALGLWCYCANQIQARAFHAHHDTRTPVRVSSAMVAVNLALNLALVWPFREAGIALATSISGLGSFVALQILIRRRFPDVDFAPAVRTVLRSLLGAAIMGAAAWAAWKWAIPATGLPETTKMGQAARLALVIGFSAAVYLGLMRILNRSEAPRGGAS